MQVREIIQEREQLDESVMQLLLPFIGLYTNWEAFIHPIYTYWSNTRDAEKLFNKGSITQQQLEQYEIEQLETLFTDLKSGGSIKLVGWTIGGFLKIFKYLGYIPGIGKVFSKLYTFLNGLNKIGQAAALTWLTSDTGRTLINELVGMVSVGVNKLEQYKPDILNSIWKKLEELYDYVSEKLSSEETVKKDIDTNIPAQPPTGPVSKSAQPATSDSSSDTPVSKPSKNSSILQPGDTRLSQYLIRQADGTLRYG